MPLLPLLTNPMARLRQLRVEPVAEQFQDLTAEPQRWSKRRAALFTAPHTAQPSPDVPSSTLGTEDGPLDDDLEGGAPAGPLGPRQRPGPAEVLMPTLSLERVVCDQLC
eukprot:EG_transcript_61763